MNSYGTPGESISSRPNAIDHLQASRLGDIAPSRPATRSSTRGHHERDVRTEALPVQGEQLEFIARALLGGPVEVHGRERAAHGVVRPAPST
jgi:hypothetical protein